MLKRLRFAGGDFAAKWHQTDPCCVIAPENRSQRRPDFRVNREFLIKFPSKGLFRGLARIEFTAGKFPKTAEMLPLRAQARENTSFRIFDHGAYHIDHCVLSFHGFKRLSP